MAVAARYVESKELPLTATLLEEVKVRPAVLDGVEAVTVPVKPQHWATIATSLAEKSSVDLACCAASRAHPTTNEVEDAAYEMGVPSRK